MSAAPSIVPPAPESETRLSTLAPTEAELFAAVDSIAGAVARRFARSSAEHADLQQEARLGLLEAVRSWREEGGRSLSSFATMHARWRVYEAMRKANRGGLIGGRPREDVGSMSSLDHEDDEGLTEHDRLGAPATQEDDCAHAEAVFPALKALPEKIRRIVALVVEGHSHEEIAERFGVTSHHVRNAMSRGYKLLQKNRPRPMATPRPAPAAPVQTDSRGRTMYKGRSATLAEFAREAGLSQTTLWRRMKAGMTLAEALEMPRYKRRDP